MTDVLLLNPPTGGDYARHESPSLGLGYLAAVLERSGYRVTIMDLAAEVINRGEFVRRLQELKPALVGITSLVNIHNTGLRLASIVKELFPETPVIMGGPHVTFLADETLSDPNIDTVCLFEAEETIVELAQYYLTGLGSLERISGIAYKKADKILHTVPRALITDLDAIPFPARHLFPKHNWYFSPGTLITGRGCPYQCQFCAAPELSRGSYRKRSVEGVIAELEEMYGNYGWKRVDIVDDTFAADVNRAAHICATMIARSLPLTWSCTVRGTPFSQDFYDILKRAGCIKICIGVESGNDLVLESIRKQATTSQIWETIKKAAKSGLNIDCYFTLGHPTDTWETALDTINFAVRLEELAKSKGALLRNMFGVITPLPGTYLYKKKEELGLKIFTGDWDKYNFAEPIMETRFLTGEQLSVLRNMGVEKCQALDTKPAI